MIDRERKLDISKLSPTEADQLSVQIGDKVRGICDEAATRINTILAVYGMSAKIAIAFDEPESIKPQTTPTKKRGRKPKAVNLKNE